jgi:epoxide hydrolase-like predicted phosphatase
LPVSEHAADRAAEPSTLKGLIVDYGGVLTSALQDTMSAWAESDGIVLDDFSTAMKDWLGTSYGDDARTNPIHALERGEIQIPHFEEQLAARLRTRDGRPVEAEGLLTRMFAGFETQPVMFEVLRQARAAAIRTALLSNSWGLDYPREGWDELFDAVVISGEVGMRKPEPGIFHHAAEALGLAPEQCVMVDDLTPNVKGAVAIGMVGVHHVDPEQTVAELEVLFGVSLR